MPQIRLLLSKIVLDHLYVKVIFGKSFKTRSRRVFPKITGAEIRSCSIWKKRVVKLSIGERRRIRGASALILYSNAEDSLCRPFTRSTLSGGLEET